MLSPEAPRWSLASEANPSEAVHLTSAPAATSVTASPGLYPPHLSDQLKPRLDQGMPNLREQVRRRR
ncbi:hypothetical protein ACFZAV_27170 [Streptomyces sp. NPDC008343]|uniref:hypothetical protein n=1 Tax=Streptomyces sp. NPDC008343 TaxID=3364828 RepID=UPI0036E39715